MNLLRHPDFHDRVRAGERPMPSGADFVEVPEPDGASIAGLAYDPGARQVKLSFEHCPQRRRAAFRVISKDRAE